MTKTPSDPKPSLVISEDVMTATLTLEAEAESPSELSVERCRALLIDKGVEVTREVKRAVKDLVAQHLEDPQTAHSADVASGEPPHVGRDGRLEFEEGFDPDSTDEADAGEPDDSDTDGAVDFYNHSVFCLVKQGDCLGRVIPPVHGSSGRNVFGDTVRVYEGRPVALQLDDSIELKPDGRLVARCAGMLEHAGKNLRVRTDLEIPDYVDFSTGNIVFGGDVVINKGVRDCFVVDATRSVTVHGLVEAATIRARGDAFLNGGMAAREKGSVHIRGNLEARYLDNVEGKIGKALIVKKEIINCHLQVKGDVASGRAVLTGGRLTVGGKTELGEIGSESGVSTELAMGRDKAVDECDERVAETLAQIEARKESLLPEYEPLLHNLQKLASDQKKRYRDLRKAIRALEDLVKKIHDTSARLHAIADQCTAIEIIVNRAIQPGVRLLLGDLSIEFNQALAGPIRIRRDKQGEMVVEDVRSGSSISITSVARVQRLGSSVNDNANDNDDDESSLDSKQAADPLHDAA